MDRRIESEDLGLKEGYMGQLPNLTVRLSCLFRISRLSTKEIRELDNQTIIVDKVDVERAIEYAWRAWGWFGQVIEIMESDVKKAKPSLPIEQAESLVLECLSDGCEKHISTIADFAKTKGKLCTATLYNSISALLLKKAIEKPRHGFYKLKCSVGGIEIIVNPLKFYSKSLNILEYLKREILFLRVEFENLHFAMFSKP